MRRAVVLLLLAVAALAPPGAARAQPAGSFSFGLVEPTGGPHDDPRAPFYVVDHVHPGDRLTRRLRLGNTTAGPLVVSLYASSADIDGGSFRFGEGRATNELTSWTRVRPREVHLRAQGRADATLVVEVPEDARPGERYGVVWAEVAPSDGSEVVNRVGVRMYLSVGEGAAPRSSVRIDDVTPRRDDSGRAVLDVRTSNVGGRAFDAIGEVMLEEEGAGGSRRVGPAHFGGTSAPGTRSTAAATWEGDVPAGPWRATVTVTANGVRERATAVVRFPSRSGTTGVAQRAEPVRGSRSAVPAVVAAALVATCSAGVGRNLLRRRRVSP